MSDYMRGYNARNQKRRSSYIKQSRQTGRSAYRNRRRKRRGGGWNYQLIAEVVVGLVVVVLLVVAGRSLLLNLNSKQANTNVASGAATGSVTEAVAAVKTISVSAIAAPTPAPRPKAVALTFDDGPSTVNTPKILDLLEKYNAHATFFVLGNRAAAGADVLKREIALGCEIGSHSWDHTNLSSLKMSGVNEQNSKTIKLVKELTGYDVKIM
ncbi:MAG: polysaccharide deacetylase family protein, partial [Eubacterium sp.]|nr:polysaccharide deacetylase family protein [Eubacterium sp.]